FDAACFSQDSRFLVLLVGAPEWSMVGFEWKSGRRSLTVPLGVSVKRMVVSPQEGLKVATAG
ncbi:unnamed protein product, partial [Discosporangium mesarthrocarpum]